MDITTTKYNTHCFYNPKAYKKLRKKLAKTDILVFRQSQHGISNSRPCYDCLQTMKSMNIRRVYYSTDNGTFVYEKVSNMVSTHKCQMRKHIDNKF
jgi:hypothetical protein